MSFFVARVMKQRQPYLIWQKNQHHNQSYSGSMIAEVGGIPIFEVTHDPNPRTSTIFAEKSLAHKGMLKNAVENAKRKSRQSRHNRAVHQARTKHVLSSLIGGNAGAMVTNRLFPTILPYPGFVPIIKRSNIGKAYKANNSKANNSKANKASKANNSKANNRNNMIANNTKSSIY